MPVEISGEKKIPVSDLDGEECFALTYAQCVLITKMPERMRTLADVRTLQAYVAGLELMQQGGPGRTPIRKDDLERKKRRGLDKLMERRLIEAVRDGNGDWMVERVCEERIDRRGKLITQDMQ